MIRLMKLVSSNEYKEFEIQTIPWMDGVSFE